MRKLPAALGIILLITSILMMIGSSFTYGGTYFDWKHDPNPLEVGNSWNISQILEREEWFKVEIVAAKDWNDRLQPAEPNIPYPYKPVFVNITSPSAEESEMLCDFILVNTQASLVFFNVTVTETHGITGVHFEPPFYGSKPGIVAKALNSGNYTVYIEAVLGGGSPPFTMRLTRGALVTERVSYYYLFYPSIALFGVSVVLIVYGFRKSRRTIHGRDLKNKKEHH